ncbi:MAG: GNAT family N-acetyltransferase [Candidatus Kariarchaeaceae archaeon]
MNNHKTKHYTIHTLGQRSFYRIEEFRSSNLDMGKTEEMLNLKQKIKVDKDFIDTCKSKKGQESEIIYRWLVLLNHSQQCIGYGGLEIRPTTYPEYETSKNSGYISISIDYSYRRKGIAKNILNFVLDEVGNIDKLHTWVVHPSGKDVCQYLGGEMKYQNQEGRLYIFDVEKLRKRLNLTTFSKIIIF